MNGKNLRRWLVLGGLLAFTGTVYADFNVQDKGTYYNNASTGLKTDVVGNLTTVDQDRDRDYPIITQLFAGQILTAGQVYSMTTAVPSNQYTRAAIMLTWGIAAADTDSVRIAVRVYGTTSSTSGNYHLWQPAIPALADTCSGTGYVAADTTITSPTRCLAPISFWVQKVNSEPSLFPSTTFSASSFTQGASVIPAAGVIRIRKIPWALRRFGSANAVMLNLTDNAGAPCPFPYIRIEVCNMGRQTLSNVEANLWPRVQ